MSDFPRIQWKRVIQGVVGSLFVFWMSSPLVAQVNDVYVPEELAAWKDWVLEPHQDLTCPYNATGTNRTPCIWVSRAEIDVSREEARAGAQFTLQLTVHSDSYLRLPFAGSARPFDVQLNARNVVVTGSSDQVELPVSVGQHTVTGSLAWEKEPPSITLPRNVAAISLKIDGVPVTAPRYEPPKLWFSRQSELSQPDSIDVKIFRRLTDSIPQMLQTTIHLSVSGTDRVVNLGNALPAGFVFTNLQAYIPARVDDDGNLSVQVSRGTHSIHVNARALHELTEFTGTRTTEIWPEREIWGFEAKPEHRVVSVLGVPSIDLNLTGSPFEDIPGFVVTPGTTLRLEEQQRTDVSTSEGVFSVKRKLWLGFDGKSFIAEDQVTANLQREQRISTHYLPGKVADPHATRLVTFFAGDEDAQPGVNLYADVKNEVLTATSLISRDQTLYATGWDVDVENLKTTVYFPPGWRLLWSHGVDRTAGSWLQKWDLWDIFLVLLLISILLRTTQYWWVCIIGFTAILTYQESVLPTIGWLTLTALHVIRNQFQNKQVEVVLKSIYWIVFTAVVIVSLIFSILHVRQAIYPQLEEQEISYLDETFFFPALEQDVAVTQAARQAYSRAKMTSQSMEDQTEEVMVSGSVIDRHSFDETVRQTGPGTPTWKWSEAQLTWYGPVKSDQEMSLVLMPPWLSRIIDALSGVLVLLVAVYFLGRKFLQTIPLTRGLQRFLPVLLIFLILPDVHADFPDRSILQELENRLTQAPECLPKCASMEHLSITTSDAELKLEARIHNQGPFAVPLPTLSNPSVDLTVTQNDASAPIPIMRNNKGLLVALLPAGISTLTIRNSVENLNNLAIEVPIKPSVIDLSTNDWDVSGIVDGVLAGSTIQLERVRAEVVTKKPKELVQERAKPYVTVERLIRFDIDTKVYSTATRVAPHEGAFRISVPLLPNEEVLEAPGNIVDNSLIVDFARSQTQVRWESRLSAFSELTLTAPDLSEYVEVWQVQGSDHWHWEHRGIKPIQSETGLMEFRPRSGEQLQLTVTKPEPVPGDYVTIESATASYDIGTRLLNGQLELQIHATQGSELQVDLPNGAKVIEILADFEEQPIPEGHLVTLPISPGELIYSVRWQLEQSIAVWFESPVVKLQLPARNVHVDVQFQGNRWTIFLAGPLLGPAVLFWGVVAVILLIALCSTVLPNFPLSRIDAVLLALGATLSNVWVLLLAGAWFVAVWVRGQKDLAQTQKTNYQAIQLGLMILSLIAIAALVLTIPRALLANPDMHIVGNSSTASMFRWYTDQIDALLPTVTVISLSNWIYLLLMLGWSLWLAFALIKWSKATWQVLNQPYLWEDDPKENSSAELPDRS